MIGHGLQLESHQIKRRRKIGYSKGVTRNLAQIHEGKLQLLANNRNKGKEKFDVVFYKSKPRRGA